MHNEPYNEDLAAGGRFAAGLLCGALIGGALGLLLAPRAGADTRHQIAEKAQRAKRRATEAYEGANRAVSGAVERSRKAVEAGKQAYVDARHRDTSVPPAGVSVS